MNRCINRGNDEEKVRQEKEVLTNLTDVRRKIKGARAELELALRTVEGLIDQRGP
jgi:hypothetical protein